MHAGSGTAVGWRPAGIGLLAVVTANLAAFVLERNAPVVVDDEPVASAADMVQIAALLTDIQARLAALEQRPPGS